MALSFSSRTSAWGPYLDNSPGRGGADFQYAWIQKESDGNPCSWTKYREGGIAQLMPENAQSIGMNIDALHPTPPCTAGTETSKSSDDLTPDQAQAQADSLLKYIDHCATYVRGLLSSAGTTWDESQPDFWQMVKYCHALPGAQRDIIAAAPNYFGGAPQNWDEFVTVAKATNCGGHGCGTTITNATAVGAYGAGGEPSFVDQIIVMTGPSTGIKWWAVALAAVGGVTLGFLAYERKRKRAA